MPKPISLCWMNSDQILNHIAKKIPKDRQAHDLPQQYEEILERLTLIFDNPSCYGIKDLNKVYVDWDAENQALAIYCTDRNFLRGVTDCESDSFKTSE